MAVYTWIIIFLILAIFMSLSFFYFWTNWSVYFGFKKKTTTLKLEPSAHIPIHPSTLVQASRRGLHSQMPMLTSQCFSAYGFYGELSNYT